MTQRKIWLADHRGRNAVVVLVSRRHAAPLGHRDDAGSPVRSCRCIKSTTETNFNSLLRRHGQAVSDVSRIEPPSFSLRPGAGAACRD
jgi:hypothetical protein